MTVTLRPLAPTDGPALARLAAESPDGGAVTFGQQYHVDAYIARTLGHHDGLSVVAEAEDRNGLAGCGSVSFGRCQFEGEHRPFAYLSALQVHPRYRRQGLATRLTHFRLEAARERLGPEAVIIAIIQYGNAGSLANARRWSRQTVSHIIGAPVPVRRRPPRLPPGLTVRPAETDELEPFAEGLNHFYADFNCAQIETGDSLAQWLRASPFATPFRHARVVANGAGNVLAGLTLVEQYRLNTMVVQRMPPVISLLNRVTHFLPPDGVLRNATVSRMWFAPGQQAAARYLWEAVRWEWRERASNLLVNFDARGPLASIYRLSRWTPQTTFTLAVHAPALLDPQRFLAVLV